MLRKDWKNQIIILNKKRRDNPFDYSKLLIPVLICKLEVNGEKSTAWEIGIIVLIEISKGIFF